MNANNAINVMRGLPKSPYHFDQFGGTLGGPIQKDRHFFFFNYDGQRNTTPNTVFLNVPAGHTDRCRDARRPSRSCSRSPRAGNSSSTRTSS